MCMCVETCAMVCLWRSWYACGGHGVPVEVMVCMLERAGSLCTVWVPGLKFGSSGGMVVNTYTY